MIELRFASPVLENGREFARMVRNCLAGVVILNMATLQANPDFPPIYQSGVRFKNEPRGVETFVDCAQCLDVGHGDCAHLAAWRVAELRVRHGIKATVCVKWKNFPRLGWRVFHVVVRYPDGRIEDISKNLGMGQGRGMRLRRRRAA